jgi:hypothetical protein
MAFSIELMSGRGIYCFFELGVPGKTKIFLEETQQIPILNR